MQKVLARIQNSNISPLPAPCRHGRHGRLPRAARRLRRPRADDESQAETDGSRIPGAKRRLRYLPALGYIGTRC